MGLGHRGPHSFALRPGGTVPAVLFVSQTMIKRCPRPHSISRAFVCNFHPPARANPRPSFCPYIPKRGFFYHSRLSLSSSLSPLSLRPHAHSVRFVPSTSLPSTTTAPPFRPPKMKFLVPLALLVAAGVSADDKTGGDSKSGCLADYIVTNCLASETKKVRSHSSISRVPLGPIEHRGMMRTICANVRAWNRPRAAQPQTGTACAPHTKPSLRTSPPVVEPPRLTRAHA